MIYLDRKFVNKGKVVIGWYHSHPNLGAFFSHTDRATQKAFFNNPYSLGVVIDPVRYEVKSFIEPITLKESIGTGDGFLMMNIIFR